MGLLKWLRRRKATPPGRYERFMERDRAGTPYFEVYEIDQLGRERLVGVRKGSRY